MRLSGIERGDHGATRVLAGHTPANYASFTLERVPFDPNQRAREKQASREADARALASGEKLPDELARENGAFAFPKERVRIVAYL